MDCGIKHRKFRPGNSVKVDNEGDNYKTVCSYCWEFVNEPEGELGVPGTIMRRSLCADGFRPCNLPDTWVVSHGSLFFNWEAVLWTMASRVEHPVIGRMGLQYKQYIGYWPRIRSKPPMVIPVSSFRRQDGISSRNCWALVMYR